MCVENTSSPTRPGRLIWTLSRVGMEGDTQEFASTNREEKVNGIIRCIYQGNNPVLEDRTKTWLDWIAFCERMNHICKKSISTTTKWIVLRQVCKYDKKLEWKLLKFCGTNLINFMMNYVWKQKAMVMLKQNI